MTAGVLQKLRLTKLSTLYKIATNSDLSDNITAQ